VLLSDVDRLVTVQINPLHRAHRAHESLGAGVSATGTLLHLHSDRRSGASRPRRCGGIDPKPLRLHLEGQGFRRQRACAVWLDRRPEPEHSARGHPGGAPRDLEANLKPHVFNFRHINRAKFTWLRSFIAPLMFEAVVGFGI